MIVKKSLVNILVILSCLISLGINSAEQSAAFFMPETQSGLMEAIVVDGEQDGAYSLTIASDPAAETFEPAVNLTNFWAAQDDTHFYFYIEVAADLSVDTWGKYNIYIDTTGDAQGATVDAWGRNVVVNDPHKPEYGIYSWVAAPYGVGNTQVVHWTGTEWDWGTVQTVDAAAVKTGGPSFIEWSVAKSKLGNPEKIWVEVWTTGDSGNAQDTANFPADDWNATDWSTTAVLDVTTPIMRVDGQVEAMYGAAAASDSSGDGNGNANMDLLDLYISENASSYYFAYTINADIVATNWGKYVLYVDTTNDSSGATTDAWGRNVVVSDPHKPEFGIYTYLDAPPYTPTSVQLWQWTGSAWSSAGSILAAALTGGAPSVIEWQVDKTSFGTPGKIWTEVWDTGGGGGDNAQDTINDPADDWNAIDWSSQAVLLNSTEFGVEQEEPEPGHDNDVWWNELGHNSRDTLYRYPGGPVTTNTPVTLRLRAASGDLTAAKVRLWNDRTDVEALLNMELVADDGEYEWWQAVVPPSSVETIYWYRFIAIDGTDMDYYEDDSAKTGGWGQVFDDTQDNSYQISVYDPDFETPDWLKNAVVYQVFPDRFCDGDETNDKDPGTFFYNEAGGTVYRSLTEDWNEVICDPRAADECAGTYSKNFYGGDLQGLMDKLDYLQSLGVTAIYLNPIFESPSNHGYDTTDYWEINPMFGDKDLFDALTAEIETRGMHLILDGVFNHVSSDSIYFDRYGRYEEVGACESATSEYRKWFFFTPADPVGSGPCVGDNGVPGGSTYESWWGYDSLPILNSENPDVRAYIWDKQSQPSHTVGGYWMQWAHGWRLDVGGDVDPGVANDASNDYWEGFRETVREVNPEGYIAGEEWGMASSWLLGNEWDGVMNYQFSSAVLSLWRDETFIDNDHNYGSSAGALEPITPQQFDERILNLIERYPPEALAAMLNLFGSHDTSRVLFMLDHNTDLNDPTLYANPAYDWSDAINRLKGAALLQMSMPGAPTIYYGDEVGLVGPMAYAGGKWEDDPYNRQPFPWLDESGTPFYTHLQTSESQLELYNYYQQLTAARNAHPALRTGSYDPLLVDNTNKVYVYGRLLPGEDAAIVIINRAATAQGIDVSVEGYLPHGAAFEDVITSTTTTVGNDGILTYTVPANTAVLLVLADEDLAQPPSAITDLEAEDIGDTYVSLNWSAAALANEYWVYRSLLSGGGYELVGTTSISEYTDTGLMPGQRVYYVVVAANTASGLVSGYSNEVTALPAYTIGWANLQWPPTINHTIGVIPTPDIYGQVWIDSVTLLPGATPSLWAQVGYGPDGSLPDGNSDWLWVDATFNTDAGNNDEFKASLLPEAVGIYDYAYRYSTNGGLDWLYADLDGTSNGYDPAQAGYLQVVASTDTTPPTAPVLSIQDWGIDFIQISWDAASDDTAVYAYDVYRSLDGTTFTKAARVYAPTLTYVDMDVAAYTLYTYKVQAVDTSFNFGESSNTVSQRTEPKMVAVTFNITVPAFTPTTVYLTRIINPDGTVGDWTPSASPLSKVTDTLWSGTFNILDNTVMEFKFARGNWETVMKGLDGNEELSNLSLTVDYGTDGTQVYEYTVLNWRDPIVTGLDYDKDAGDFAYTGTDIRVSWSQSMAADTCLTLTGPGGQIPGVCTYDDSTFTVTFNPDVSLQLNTAYEVTVSGEVDAAGDWQQVAAAFEFTTFEGVSLFLPAIFR